ncbi:MAG: tyrosine-type recombinase/integrase [Actinobacteria bacterium]|nr:tyrosine-type recombinase/integrase [Actinomycetota bacterium]
MSTLAYRDVGFASLLRDVRHEKARAAGDLAHWLVYLELEGKADRTLYEYVRKVAPLLRAHPEKTLAEFTSDDINAVLSATPKRSRHIVRSIINRFFVWAEQQDRIDKSPMRKVATIKHPERRVEGTFTIAQVASLEALPSPDGQLFAILFGSGLRKAEARRLRREHVDLDRRRLIVREGKGGKDRIVALTPGALQAVADLDLTEGLRPWDHLWYTKPGGGNVISRRWPMGDTTYSRWYSLLIERAKVPYLRPHATRHTYHELMRLAGLSLEERQLLMGHVSIRTTADIYGHLSIEDVSDKLATFSLADL